MTDKEMASYMAITFPQRPEPLYAVYQEYAGHAPIPQTACPHSNFLKGVQWSPDGACLLTASDDNWLRVYDLPQDALDVPASAATAADCLPPTSAAAAAAAGEAAWQQEAAQGDLAQADSFPAALRVQEGETIYDMAWYPGMTTADAASCCFATSSRAHPIHLWDACAGGLRCTYRGYNDVDEVTAAFSVCFSPDGQQILGGYNKCIMAFDVGRPGREYKKITTYVKKNQDSLPGMVSCMAFSPDGGNTLAAGSYSGDIGLYDARTWELLYLLKGHKGGLTQVRFTPDGNFLISGARQDSSLICWDLRSGAEGELYRMERDTGRTNQRIQFDLEPCGRHLATGGADGCVRVFDLQSGSQVDDIRVALDTVNGCSFHPSLNLLAVATGQRRYPIKSCPLDDHHDSEESSSGGPGGIESTDEGNGARKRTHEEASSIHTPQKRQQLTDASLVAQAADGSAESGQQLKLASGQGLVKGGGLENVLRVFRLGYQIVEYAPEVVEMDDEAGKVLELQEVLQEEEAVVEDDVVDNETGGDAVAAVTAAVAVALP